MSNYTTKIKDMCDVMGRDKVEQIFTDYKLEDYLTTSQIETINSAGIWSKEKLAKKIVNHYYMREIGFETVGLFTHYAKSFIAEIMEDYLPVVYSNAIKFEPLVNVDFTETYTKTNTGTSENEGTSNTSSQNNANGISIHSDTPSSKLNIENIKAGNYASDVSTNDTETTTNSEIKDKATAKVDNLEEYTKITKGNSGVSATAQALIKQYRDIIRAVDREIIDELNVLFMGLY